MSGANQVVKFANTNREKQLAPLTAIGTEFHQRVPTLLSAANSPAGVIPASLFTTDFVIEATSPAGLTGPSAVQLCQYFQTLATPGNQGLNPTAIGSRFTIMVENGDTVARVLTFGANVAGGPVTLQPPVTPTALNIYELSFELLSVGGPGGVPPQAWELFSMSQNILPFVPSGGVAPVEFGAFFGMTAGPGNTGANDYPAPFAASAAGPSVAATSAINFPRLSAPVVGGITINNPGVAQTNNTEFLLPSVGTYNVRWHISVTEPGQWSLFQSAVPNQAAGGVFNDFVTALGTPGHIGQATGTSQMSGDVTFANTAAGNIIQIRNYAASGGTMTATALPGGTQAQAVSLIIQRLV